MSEIGIDYLQVESLDSSLFGNQNPFCLEIGCGQDPFLLKMAVRHPEWNFIGIELENWVLGKLLKKARKVALPNLKLLRSDARTAIFEKVAYESVHEFYINHPDPWPKTRHRRRRLVKDEFLEMLISKLVPGGKLFYSSDFEDYALQVAGKLHSTGLTTSLFPGRLYSTDFPDYPRTRFMRRFLNLGQPIYFVAVEKNYQK
ncbi:MAG: tRNA (guanosine(46)-N7)-methyltransferase TrmB [Candidatus Wallbacteria bacterium]|nr:tRNA (guanosine(46)-N7)-methyltransferase TrmB [Candidatus Wallbacteria bacterium]